MLSCLELSYEYRNLRKDQRANISAWQSLSTKPSRFMQERGMDLVPVASDAIVNELSYSTIKAAKTVH